MSKDPNFKIQFNTIYCCVTIIKNIFLCVSVVFANSMKMGGDKIDKKIDMDLNVLYR